MHKIVLLGAGNLASHLFTAIQKTKEFSIIQVYNRSLENLTPFKKKVDITTSIAQIKSADLYIVCVSDDAITSVIQNLSSHNGLVVHTSGSVPLTSVAHRNGVFYPLQTFSKQASVDFSTIPICIEAQDVEDLTLLRQLGLAISKKVYPISSEQRKSLHLAAVFACNFTNHLYRIAEEICAENQVPFEILHPLIAETAHKIQVDSPHNVQTGPAKRGDQKTIDFHLSQLNSPELKEIYTLLTRLIQQEHGSKL